jgi:hypothetical protein
MAETLQDVLGTYRDRLAKRQRSLKPLLRRLSMLRYTRAASGFGIPAVLWLAFALHVVPAWLAVLPALVYLALDRRYESVYADVSRVNRAVAYYERAIARVEDCWAGKGISDTTLVDPGHLYAGDLDLFGTGSLFELLCTAKTGGGQETLAKWLATPASREEILQRQEAVEELRNNLDLREDLWVSASYESLIDMAAIDQWTSTPAIFSNATARYVARFSWR